MTQVEVGNVSFSYHCLLVPRAFQGLYSIFHKAFVSSNPQNNPVGMINIILTLWMEKSCQRDGKETAYVLCS